MLELCSRDADLDRLHLRAQQLRFGLHDVRARNDAGVVAVLREIKGALIRGDRFVQQLLLPIGNPQPEVELCKLRLQAQT